MTWVEKEDPVKSAGRCGLFLFYLHTHLSISPALTHTAAICSAMQKSVHPSHPISWAVVVYNGPVSTKPEAKSVTTNTLNPHNYCSKWYCRVMMKTQHMMTISQHNLNTGLIFRPKCKGFHENTENPDKESK